VELLLATTNVHKIREFRQLLKQLAPHLDIITLMNFPEYEAPEENGTTFEANARLKAIHAAQHLKCWTLADDSGLVVPTLQGAPGVYSRRYAGPDASDADNRRKLLQAMEQSHDLERAAYYNCTLALAHPDGICKVVQGQCEGYIAYNEKGRHGFGYDALFIKHDYDKSFAELDESIKNRISHRAKAIEKISPILLQSLRE
jgi:XTP/dITP diphosphohydrolase